ncbi:hypothetical protein [Yoonia tamlensis]|uniref:hypothetical protein n=1 Tax=Yoonia tamlensis TaxID=390270 RepID=UPI0010424AD4|nr:hypothetical protein [Yoonia tamlensis]
MLRAIVRWHVLPFATLRIGGCTCLLVAPSFGGKSTLIAHALAQRRIASAQVTLIDDNTTWIDRSGRAVCVRRPLKIRQETLGQLARNLPPHRKSTPHRDGSLYVTPTASARYLSRHRINALVVLDRHVAHPRLEILSARSADEASSYHLRQRLGRLPAAGLVTTLARVLRTPDIGLYKLNYRASDDGLALLAELKSRHPR